MSRLTTGRIVHDRLTDEDADDINKRRDDFEAFQRSRAARPPGATGHIAHVSHPALAGDAPAVIVLVPAGPTVANLQVSLDGNDSGLAEELPEPGDADSEVTSEVWGVRLM